MTSSLFRQLHCQEKRLKEAQKLREESEELRT